jgi:hypothetical protein
VLSIQASCDDVVLVLRIQAFSPACFPSAPLGTALDFARRPRGRGPRNDYSLEDLAGGGRATTIRSKTSRGLTSLDKPVTLFVAAASDLPHYRNAGGECGAVGA